MTLAPWILRRTLKARSRPWPISKALWPSLPCRAILLWISRWIRRPLPKPPADLNVPAAPVADLSVADLSFDDGLDFAQVEQAQQPEISAAAADPFAAPFAAEAEGLSADALAEFTAPAAEVPNYQTHDAIASAEVSDMDTPLEAKLELAKMYLEIDDAATARETLRELIAESNGSSIQDQAKALLAELGN